ncbi:hypothetical protein GCM10017687_38250 [Streptomyces echinatus]|uniref:hypothetical protein n=1 Tax=Streptomyces echinatus TaxID=67293 RepID=UPI0031EE2A15
MARSPAGAHRTAEGGGRSDCRRPRHRAPRWPPRSRLRWWTELPLILLVYGCYSAGRLLARGDVAGAVDHGLTILRVEKALHLNAEHR